MEPDTIIQLRQKLESIKEFQRRNASSRFSYFGYLGELFLGAIILGQLVINKGISTIEIFGIPHFINWILFVISLVLMSHGLYLMFRFHSDRRISKILESVLHDLNNETSSPASTEK